MVASWRGPDVRLTQGVLAVFCGHLGEPEHFPGVDGSGGASGARATAVGESGGGLMAPEPPRVVPIGYGHQLAGLVLGEGTAMCPAGVVVAVRDRWAATGDSAVGASTRRCSGALFALCGDLSAPVTFMMDRTGWAPSCAHRLSSGPPADGWLRVLCTCVEIRQDWFDEDHIVVDRFQAASWYERANWRWCLPSADQPTVCGTKWQDHYRRRQHRWYCCRVCPGSRQVKDLVVAESGCPIAPTTGADLFGGDVDGRRGGERATFVDGQTSRRRAGDRGSGERDAAAEATVLAGVRHRGSGHHDRVFRIKLPAEDASGACDAEHGGIGGSGGVTALAKGTLSPATA